MSYNIKMNNEDVHDVFGVPTSVLSVYNMMFGYPEVPLTPKHAKSFGYRGLDKDNTLMSEPKISEVLDKYDFEVHMTASTESFKMGGEDKKTETLVDKLLTEISGKDKEMLISLTHKIIIIKASYATTFYYSKRSEKIIDEIIEVTSEILTERKNVVRDDIYYINMISEASGQYYTQEFEIKGQNIGNENLFDCYNEEVVKGFNVISEAILEDTNGLYIINGEPGTGKTTLIKNFINQNKEVMFYYLTNSVVHSLENSSFLNFLIEERSDNSDKQMVLLIEDAETFLKTRDKGNSLATAILNLTDGILGEMVKIPIIATYNNKEHIDEALLRKGRLKYNLTVDKLKGEKLEKLNKELGNDVLTENEIKQGKTLADLFNADKNVSENSNDKKKIGFI